MTAAFHPQSQHDSCLPSMLALAQQFGCLHTGHDSGLEPPNAAAPHGGDVYNSSAVEQALHFEFAGFIKFTKPHSHPAKEQTIHVGKSATKSQMQTSQQTVSKPSKHTNKQTHKQKSQHQKTQKQQRRTINQIIIRTSQRNGWLVCRLFVRIVCRMLSVLLH